MANKKRGTGRAPQISRVNLGLLDEYMLKKLDAEQRLSQVFAAFVKLQPGGGYFICGGNVQFSHMSSFNFSVVIVGASLSEVSQGEDLIRRVGSRINSLFSEKDFHSTVVMDFLSKYLKANLQNMKIPQAIAVEFFITDIMDNLFRVHFNGDIEIDSSLRTDNDVLLIGCYDEKFRDSLLGEFKKAPRVIDKEKMSEFAKEFKDKLKLSQIGFII